MKKILFYVQHLLGIGHQRRAELLAGGLVDGGFDVTILSGGAPIVGEDWHGSAVIRLPPVRSDGTDFSRLVDLAGRPIDDAWRAERQRRVLATLTEVAPDVLLIEGFPFARRQFRFELLPLLKTARACRPAPLVVTSIRDILVAKPAPERVAEVVETVRRLVDRVLIHGDPQVIELQQSFAGAARIADRLAYTGYIVAAETRSAFAGDRVGVVVSAGGGAVGGPLLRAALAARPLSALANRPWRLLTGPNLPECEFDSLVRAAPSEVFVERQRSDFPKLLARAELSISQAGYNTVLEVLRARTRAVLAPFAAPGETEQSLRAGLLADAGRVAIVSESELSGATLAAAIDRALAGPPPDDLSFDCDGANTSARLLHQWLASDPVDARVSATSR